METLLPNKMALCLQKPHIVMDAAPWGNNVFHFYNDLAMPLFQTMVEQGWISGHEWDVREEPPDYPGAAAVGLIGEMMPITFLTPQLWGEEGLGGGGKELCRTPR